MAQLVRFNFSYHLENWPKLLFVYCIICISPGCQKDDTDDHYEFPHFGNATEQVIASNLEFPAGLSSGQKRKSGSTGTDNQKVISGIFTEGPLFQFYHEDSGFHKYINPIVSEFEGTLENIQIQRLAEFEIEKYFYDFDTYSYYALEDSIWRTLGLTLDGLVMNDGTVLVSSNSSDKLYRIGANGEIEIFMEGDELRRITDMIQGKDGKIYLAQAPLVDENNALTILSPKRVISISNGILKTEFELPTDTYYSNYSFEHIPLWAKQIPFFEKLKIIENSDIGKRRFGTVFYVSDQLGDVIYKVDSMKNVSVITENVNFPTSLAVDSIGDLFYTTSPVYGDFDLPIFKPAIYALNPETLESIQLYSFEMSTNPWLGETLYVKDYGKRFAYTLIGFTITNVLYESPNKIEFLISNSQKGTLEWVIVKKQK